MKQIMKLSFGLILIALFSFTASVLDEGDCTILHEGTFKYGGNHNIKVVIKANKHTEYHNGGKYVIKSKLVWVNKCEYNMTIEKINLPDFPFKKGDTMNVKIDKVVGNEIYYTSTIRGKSWEGKLIKME